MAATVSPRYAVALLGCGAALMELIRFCIRRAEDSGPSLRSLCQRLASKLSRSMYASKRAVRSNAEAFFSARIQSLPPSPLYAGPYALAPLMKLPSVHVMCGGVPPSESFPLEVGTMNCAGGLSVELDTNEVALAQRYAPFAWNGLKAWLHQHVREIHNPPGEWDLTIGAGSMSSVDICVSMLCDRGDVVLVEEFSFLAGIDVLRSAGVQLIPVKIDKDGIVPSALEELCMALAKEGVHPKLLYTVPVGQNPTGSRLPASRYSHIYETAKRHDFVILEDDAYFYQQHRASWPSSDLPGLVGLGPSFLSIDTDGRVIRLDSFSKVLAPGFRLGWVSGAPHWVAKYNALCYASSQWGCSLSIMLLGKMLSTPGWFEAHVLRLQAMMRSRCLALLRAADAQLKPHARWHAPDAGMFLWLELERAPASREQLVGLMREHLVVALPGEDCAVAPPPAGRRHLRLTYVLPEGEYDAALTKLVAVLRQCDAGAAS